MWCPDDALHESQKKFLGKFVFKLLQSNKGAKIRLLSEDHFCIISDGDHVKITKILFKSFLGRLRYQYLANFVFSPEDRAVFTSNCFITLAIFFLKPCCVTAGNAVYNLFMTPLLSSFEHSHFRSLDYPISQVNQVFQVQYLFTKFHNFL